MSDDIIWIVEWNWLDEHGIESVHRDRDAAFAAARAVPRRGSRDFEVFSYDFATGELAPVFDEAKDVATKEAQARMFASSGIVFSPYGGRER